MADKVKVEVSPWMEDQLDFHVDDLHHIYTPRDEWRGDYIETLVENAGYGPREMMQIVADCKVAFDSHQVPAGRGNGAAKDDPADG